MSGIENGLRVVIAPDSFKGSLSAPLVAAAIAEGWLSVRGSDRLSLIPQADGGEGTLDAIESAIASTVRHHVGPVTAPGGGKTPGSWLELAPGVAVVELAQIAGLPLMTRLDPLRATTVGLGEVILHALTSGISRLVVTLGGSASTDGGAGALAALGLRSDGDLRHGGGPLSAITALDLSALRPAPRDGVLLLTDVHSPLLGSCGASAVFAPQKGASKSEVAVLESSLTNFARLLGGDPTLPGTGAAGGAAYGFSAAWGAQIEPGADHLAGLTGLARTLADADVLITGEGKYDSTSGTGKVVGRLIGQTGEQSARVTVICGQLELLPRTANGIPIEAFSLVELAGSVEAALDDPTTWLRAGGAAAAAAENRRQSVFGGPPAEFGGSGIRAPVRDKRVGSYPTEWASRNA